MIGQRLSPLTATAPRATARRTDWRFLLPAPHSQFEHLVLLGAPPDLPSQLLDSGLARQVSLAPLRSHSADAVVVLSGAQPDLLDVAGSLKPGGALYYEVDRRSPDFVAATPGRLQRWLRAAGLTPAGMYWAAPDLAGCRRYIPLDTSHAFHWYLATLFVAGTAMHRLLEIGMHLAQGQERPPFALVVPCYAVTATAGPPPAPAILAHLNSPSELRPIVLTSGQDMGSRTVVLPFAPGSWQPLAVYKISTRADFNQNTEREQASLQEIRSRLDTTLRETIPRPLGLLRFGALTVGIESCARGHPLLVTSGRWRASFEQQLDDLRLAAGWLRRFHRQAETDRWTWNEGAIERWVETPLAAYVRTFGQTLAEARLFALARQRARVLTGASFPIVWLHYDFGPWNLYRQQDAFTVIDWEFGRNWERDRSGPALYDLLYLVTYWNHTAQHVNGEAAELDALERLFVAKDGGDRHAQAAHHVIMDYMESMGIDRRFLPLMLVYMWVEQALHQTARKRVLGETQPEPRASNRCVRYIEVLAAHADRLFADWGQTGEGRRKRRRD